VSILLQPGLAVTDGTPASFSVVAVAIGLVLLVGNGAFVAAEISLLAARRSGFEEAAQAGDRRAKRALAAHQELSVTFSAAQLGITMCSLGLGAIAERAVQAMLIDLLAETGVPEGAIPVLSFVVALSLVVFLHMVIGEMAPRNLAIAAPERVALRLMRPFAAFILVFRPVVLLLNLLANLLVRLVRVEPVDERRLVHTPEELALALAESKDLGTIAPQDARMMGAALRLAAIDAEAAMTPRVDLDAVSDEATVAEVLAVAAETGHTRIPIYHEQLDHIVGLVHVKDALIRDDPDQERLAVTDLLRPIPAVPESRDLEHLLRDMLDSSSHAVVVVDEFGGTAGLLTLEDVLEELVGEIADEFDDEVAPEERAGRSWTVPGTMRRDEVEALTGLVLDAEDTETLSGYLVERLGRLLKAGDSTTTDDGWHLTVRTLEGRRAGEVEIEAPLTFDDGATSTSQ
jgi:CBS domain containing-hemolysin-like protein